MNVNANVNADKSSSDLPRPVDADKIKTWAVANKDRAKKLGLMMVMNQANDAFKMDAQPEDDIITWAKANKAVAMKTFMELMPLIK